MSVFGAVFAGFSALAVATVKASGVRHINDLYAVVTDRCGTVYKNCSICDDERKDHGPPLNCPDVVCGAHYVTAGWELLATATSNAIRAALQG